MFSVSLAGCCEGMLQSPVSLYSCLSSPFHCSSWVKAPRILWCCCRSEAFLNEKWEWTDSVVIFFFFLMQAQCLKEATMSVITKCFSKDQLDMAKSSPEITSARCFKMIDTCSAALWFKEFCVAKLYLTVLGSFGSVRKATGISGNPNIPSG